MEIIIIFNSEYPKAEELLFKEKIYPKQSKLHIYFSVKKVMPQPNFLCSTKYQAWMFMLVASDVDKNMELIGTID